MNRREALGSMAAMLLPASPTPKPCEGLTYYHRGFAFDVDRVLIDEVFVKRYKIGQRDAQFRRMSVNLEVWNRDMAGAAEGIALGRYA